MTGLLRSFHNSVMSKQKTYIQKDTTNMHQKFRTIGVSKHRSTTDQAHLPIQAVIHIP